MAYFEGFSRVYDIFMADTPYTAWADYIDILFKKYLNGKTPDGNQDLLCNPESAANMRSYRTGLLVADLACGTGNMTMRLAEKGYDMIGVDASVDMLSEAKEKTEKSGLNILFLAQDVRRLDLYGTIDAACAVCDGFSYLLSEAELFAAFSRCALFLNPGGVFIFDLNTEYKFSVILKNDTFTDTRGEASYIWKNNYDEDTRINEYNLFITTQEDEHEEMHYQRAYPTDVVEGLLADAGFELLMVNDAYTYDPPREDSVRLSFVARKVV